MQTRRNRTNYAMTLLPPLESLVPEDHKLRRLGRVLDLSFVHDVVKDRYCQTNGRPSIDPEVVIRLFLLQALEGLSSVRELMRQVQVNLAYRWFIGYELDESLPDHSSLSRALDRFGDEIFGELFARSVKQCQSSGLIEGKVLYVDATTIRADLDMYRVGKPDSPDPDARFGRFPDEKMRPGYKQQTVVDGRSRVVVGLSVKPANESDTSDFVETVDATCRSLGFYPEALCADAGYSSGKNCAKLLSRGIRLISPPPRPITYTGRDQFTTEDFLYDTHRDEFTCPAGHKLRYLNTERWRGRRQYRARPSACGPCPLKPRCTRSDRRQLKVTRYHSALIRLRADSQTESFKRLYRSRAPVIEGVFAEAKQWHGLGRAWRRGLCKMKVQSLLVATVLNFKRLMALVHGHFGLLVHVYRLLKAVLASWRRATASP